MAQKQSKKIENVSSVDKLTYIHNTIKKITAERIDAAVNSITKRETVVRLLNIFSQFANDFVEEQEDLAEKAPMFNKKYATEYNTRFSSAYNLLKNIKHSIFSFYHVVGLTHKNPTANYGPIYTSNSTDVINKMDHSPIGNLPVEGSLFKKTPTQERLADEIRNFLKYLDNSLDICLKTIREEEETGNNDAMLQKVLSEQIDEIYQYVKDKSVKDSAKYDSYIYELADFENNPDTVREYFHKKDPKTLVNVAMVRRNRQCSKYSKNERKTFKDNISQIEKNRAVIAHIPEYYDKITGDIVIFTMMYVGYIGAIATFNKCFMDVYEECHGEAKGVSNTQVHNAITKWNNDKSTDQYNNFEQTMDTALL